MKKAIKRAIEGGYVMPCGIVGLPKYCKPEEIREDPLFWQALGKACGWGNSELYEDTLPPTRQCGAIPYWKLNWHRFIDHIAEGGNVDNFFENLCK